MSTELPDAVIAGIMGWRGPGAYTAATLRKIREDIRAAVEADRAQQGEPVKACEAFKQEIDAQFPIPDSPHTSVIQRAMDNRTAFWLGWNAARRFSERAATKAAAPADAPVMRKVCTSSDVVRKNSPDLNINGAAPVPDTGIPTNKDQA